MPAHDTARLKVLNPAMSPATLPVAVQIRMSEGEHQIATLTVLTPLERDRQALDAAVPANLVLPEGTPVALLFGSSAADTAVWYGYVASRQVQSSKAQHGNTAAPVVPVVYTCTGISMPMQSTGARVLTGVSASAAARSVIGGYNIASYIQPHPRIWPALAQGGLSDFAWLCQLAKLIGYRLIVDADRIAFVDAATDLTPSSVLTPVFNRDVLPGVWDSLISFDPAAGQTDPRGATVSSYTAYAVRPSSGISAVSTHAPPIAGLDGTMGAPLFTRVAPGSAQSYSDAQYNAIAQGAASRYWVYAPATVDGYTGLRPGRTVKLAGAGIKASDTGLWRVGTVTHAVTLSALGEKYATYYAHLELGRDQAGSLSMRALSPALGRAPAMSLVGNRWVSPGAGGAA